MRGLSAASAGLAGLSYGPWLPSLTSIWSPKTVEVVAARLAPRKRLKSLGHLRLLGLRSVLVRLPVRADSSYRATRLQVVARRKPRRIDAGVLAEQIDVSH